MSLTVTIPGAVLAEVGATAPATLVLELGVPGPTGATGAAGATGAGVAAGGTTGMALVKVSGTNYDTTWASMLPLAGGTMSGTLYAPTIANILNTNLVVDAYNDTGAGTHNYFNFNPYGGGFELPTSSTGITFGDATVQATAAT